MNPLLSSAVALAVTYAILGSAVAIVVAATRRLHLVLGHLLVAGVLVAAIATSPAFGLPTWVGLMLALVVGASASAALGPMVLDRTQDPLMALVGLIVVAGTIDALLARGVTAATIRPDPLVSLPAVGGIDPAVGAAVVLGLPSVLLLALVLARTRWGRRVRIVGGSPLAAVQLGIVPARVRTQALAVAGAATVLAGLLAAPVATVGTGQATAFTVRGVAAAALLGGGGPLAAIAGGGLLAAVEVLGTVWWPAAGGEVAVGVTVVTTLMLRRGVRGRGWERAW